MMFWAQSPLRINPTPIFFLVLVRLGSVQGLRGPLGEVIGPAQWDEDVLGIYWTLVMGSAASEKHEKEERTEAHEAGCGF